MPDLRRHEWITIGLIGLFLVGWLTLVFLMSPDELVRRLGVTNAYGVVLWLSIIGALGSMTTFSSYPAVVTFATGGLSPWLLGLISGVGLTLGDAIFYGLLGRVKGLLRGRAEKRAVQLGGWLERRPEWVVPVTTYVWVGLLPLANNILTGALAITGYRFRRILFPLFLGNVTFPTAVAYLACAGIDLFG